MEMSSPTVHSEVNSVTAVDYCGVSPCSAAAVAEFGARPLCVEHFVSVSMQELDSRSASLRGRVLAQEEAESFKELLATCAQLAHRLSESACGADTRTKARLLDVLLRASQLSQSLRRSPRVQTAVSVYLRREDSTRTWEEETWTSTISRHGAGLECRHLVEKGGTVVLCRKDGGDRARARVVYCHFDGQGRRQIGLEFLDRSDFWERAGATPAAGTSITV
jgi:hypothetical protein